MRASRSIRTHASTASEASHQASLYKPDLVRRSDIGDILPRKPQQTRATFDTSAMLQPRSSLPRTISLFAVYCLLLFASFSHDLFWVMGKFRAGHIGYDSYLVLNRLKLATEGADLFYPLGEYRSQFGLQGALFSQIMLITGIEPVKYAHWAADACSLLTAAVLAVFFVSVARTLGLMAAHAGVMFTALSPILLEFGPSLYWCSFLLFAPFVCVWTVYPWCRVSRLRRLGLAAAVLLLVMLKCLCGYEYITTVALSPVAAVVFHLVRQGEFRPSRIMELAAWTAAGCTGFALAIGLHVLQLYLLMGPSGPDVILQRAQARIGGDPRTEVAMDFSSSVIKGIPEPIGYPLNCFLHYFKLRAIHCPGTAGVPFAVPAVLALAVLIWAVLRQREMSADVRALSWSLVVSLATSLSWQMLAVNHMSVHFHLNQIVYWMPFLLLTGVFVGHMAQQVLSRWNVDALVLRFMVPACLLFIMGNAVRHSLHEARQERCTALVQKQVAAKLNNKEPVEPWPGIGFLGCIDATTASSDLGDEMARSALATAAPVERLMIQGWFIDPKEPDCPKSVCLLRKEGDLEMADCQFLLRRDVNEAQRISAARAGFAITVPKPRPGDRILLLCGRDFSRVVQMQSF